MWDHRMLRGLRGWEVPAEGAMSCCPCPPAPRGCVHGSVCLRGTLPHSGETPTGVLWGSCTGHAPVGASIEEEPRRLKGWSSSDRRKGWENWDCSAWRRLWDDLTVAFQNRITESYNHRIC